MNNKKKHFQKKHVIFFQKHDDVVKILVKIRAQCETKAASFHLRTQC